MKAIRNTFLAVVLVVCVVLGAVALRSAGQVQAYDAGASTVPTVRMPFQADNTADATVTPEPTMTATPEPTAYPTQMTMWDQHFKQLNDAIKIPDGKDRVTVPYLGSNGKYYLIQKFIDPSTQQVDFAIYRAEKIFIQDPNDAKKAIEVVVPRGTDIGQEAFFYEAVKVKWLTANDFKDLPSLSNNPWYTNP